MTTVAITSTNLGNGSTVLIDCPGMPGGALALTGGTLNITGPTGPSVTGPTGPTGPAYVFVNGTVAAVSNAATLNTVAGAVTASISSASSYTLTLTNSAVASTSIVIWNAYDSSGNIWAVTALTPSNGAVAVSFASLSSPSSGTLHMNYLVA